MTKQIPSLRFPQFAEHSEWEEKKIGEILKIGSGKDYKHLKQGNIPVFGSGGLMTFVDAYLYDGETVCIGRKGTIDKPTYYNGKIWTVDTLFYTHSFNSYPKFAFALFQKINWKEHNEASGVPSLSKSTIEKIKITLPSLAEQTQIADFLTAVDKRISLLKQKHELLKAYKKGIMQQIFSQELRFKDDAGQDFPEWEEKTLGEVGETYGGLTGKTKENFGSGKPYIQYKQIFDNSKIDISKCDLVEILPNEKQHKVKYGDVFFTISSETPNEIGMSSVLLNEVLDLYLNSFCFGYRIHDFKKFSPLFACFLFRNPFFRKEIIKLAQGTTRFNMSKTKFLELSIPLPCLSEQKKIAEFLTAIDDKIEKVGQQIAQSEEWKRGLLQCMLV